MSKKRMVPLNALTAAADPSTPTPRLGDIYYNTGSNDLRFYNGSTWSVILTGAPSNMVTTDTTQSISGAKTFTVSTGVQVTGNNSDSGLGVQFNTGVAPGANTKPGSPVARFTARKDVSGTPSSASIDINAVYLQLADASPVLSISAPGGIRASAAIYTFGLTGAQSTARWVGATSSGAPSSGTFLTGDWVVSQNGHVWICTSGGSPGTWVEAFPANMVTTDTTQNITAAKAFVSDNGVIDPIELKPTTLATVGLQVQDSPYLKFTSNRWTGAVSATDPITLNASRVSATSGDQYLAVFGSHNGIKANSFKPNGLTGATAASRYVGAVSSTEVPASGTFVAGDWVITQLGSISVCTVGGSPGTWITAYSDGNPPVTLLKTEGSTPSTPAANLLVEWVSSTDSRPYWKNDGGEVGAMWSVEPYTFSVTGTIAVATGKSKITLEGNYVVETVRANVNTAPTGASLIVDVNKNGTTIYTTQSARPTIAASATTATGNSPAITTFAAGDVLTVDVDQIGSTIAGADLTVTIRLRRVA